MTHNYQFLGFVLDAGSWADWFAGTMSFAAVATALGGYWFSERAKRSDARERELRASESISWKLILTMNRNELIHNHIGEGLAASGSAKSIWKFAHVRPLGVPTQQSVALSSDEISAMVLAKALDQALDLSECIQRLESIEYSMHEYKTRHEALFELLPPPTAVEGMVFSHFLDRDEQARALPYTRMLDSLIADIFALTQINREKLAGLMKSFPVAMEKHFGKWTIKFSGEDLEQRGDQ